VAAVVPPAEGRSATRRSHGPADIPEGTSDPLRGGRVTGVSACDDERVGEEVTAPGDDIERLMYGYSVTCCLPDGLAARPSVGTGTVMRPPTLRRYAREAGFAGADVPPIESPFYRFNRLPLR
jgi:hypothetical protein